MFLTLSMNYQVILDLDNPIKTLQNAAQLLMTL